MAMIFIKPDEANLSRFYRGLSNFPHGIAPVDTAISLNDIRFIGHAMFAFNGIFKWELWGN
jgi:hypothetical protein